MLKKKFFILSTIMARKAVVKGEKTPPKKSLFVIKKIIIVFNCESDIIPLLKFES